MPYDPDHEGKALDRLQADMKRCTCVNVAVRGVVERQIRDYACPIHSNRAAQDALSSIASDPNIASAFRQGVQGGASPSPADELCDAAAAVLVAFKRDDHYTMTDLKDAVAAYRAAKATGGAA